jgi:phosphatidylglycerol:prolipoprotein diacylglycerol transferase
MYPEILGFVKSYGLMLALSFAVGLWLNIRRGRVHGVSAEAASDLIFGVLVSSIIGVRLAYVLTHLGGFDPWYRAFFIWDGGLTLYGGIILATLTVYVMCRRRGIPFLVAADMISPAVVLGIGLTRIGCFMAGCCYGHPSDIFCHVTFPAAAPASLQFGLVPVHPSQLYASAGGFLVFAVLLGLEKVWDYRGATFGRFLLLYGASRFAVDFSRYYEPEQVMALGWSNNQWFSVALMLVGLVVLVTCWRARANRGGARV